MPFALFAAGAFDGEGLCTGSTGTSSERQLGRVRRWVDVCGDAFCCFGFHGGVSNERKLWTFTGARANFLDLPLLSLFCFEVFFS